MLDIPHKVVHTPISLSLGLKKYMKFKPNTLETVHEPKRILGNQGEKLIKHFESCELEAYWDTIGKVWTIGFGNTFYEAGSPVKKGDIITQERADELFWNIVKMFSVGVEEEVQGLDLSQNELDSLISFAYNVGLDAFKDSTLLEVIKNDKHNYSKIEYQWLRWRYSKGKFIQGLLNRRKAAYYLYRFGELLF